MSPEVFNARKSRSPLSHTAREARVDEATQDQSDLPQKSNNPGQNDASTQTNASQPQNTTVLNPDTPHRKVDDYSEVMRAEACSTNPFDSFAPKPEHVFFDSQHKSETVLLLLRKHPITQIPKILGAIFFGIFPILLPALGLGFTIPANFAFAGYVLWYLFLIGFVLETFLTWFFQVFIITDERIIDVDFMSLIYKRITAAKIDNIEDVTAVTGGAIRSVFNFGTVKIQTAGARPEIAFEDVPQPSKVKRLLNELLLEEEREKIEGRVN